MRDPNENPLGSRKHLKAIGLAAGLGCSIVAAIVLSILGGILLDRWLDTTPIFTLAGVVLGIFIAGSQLYRLARVDR